MLIKIIHNHEGITPELLKPSVKHLADGFHRLQVLVDKTGYTHCVPVDDKVISWKRRGTRPYASPIVSGSPVKTNYISIICKVNNGICTVITAFWGKLAPKEPENCLPSDNLQESIEFWSTHALLKEKCETYKEDVVPQWYNNLKS